MENDIVYHGNVIADVQIRDFSLLQKPENFITIDVEGDEDLLDFQIKIYPNVDKHVAVYITKEIGETLLSKFEIICDVNVINVEGLLKMSRSFAYSHTDKSDVFIFGLEKCFERDKIFEDPDEFLPGDVLSLHFKLSYHGKRINTPIRQAGRTLKRFSNLIESGQRIRNLAQEYCMQIQQDCTKSSTKTLQKIRCTISVIFKLTWFIIKNIALYRIWKAIKWGLGAELKSNNLLRSTFTIETMNGSIFEMHKIDETRSLEHRLCKVSPVFPRMINALTLERLNQKITVTDFDSTTLSIFLHFIKYGEVKWPKEFDEIYTLYEMANKYEVLTLMTLCSRCLAQNINKENVVDIATLAVMHCDKFLKKAISSFFETKGILLIGKTKIETLYQVSKNVRFLEGITEETLKVKNIHHTYHINKHVMLIRKFEDVCILYEIAQEFEVNNMINECVRYMKQSITYKQVPVILNFAKRCYNRTPLSFVIDFITQNAIYLSDEQKDIAQSLLSPREISSLPSLSKSLA